MTFVSGAIKADRDAASTAGTNLIVVFFQQHAVCAKVYVHASFGKVFDDGKDILAHQGLAACNADLVNSKIAELTGQGTVFCKSQLILSQILPPLTHPAPAVAPIGNIKFSQIRTCYRWPALLRSCQIFSGLPQGRCKSFRKQHVTIAPKIIETHLKSPDWYRADLVHSNKTLGGGTIFDSSGSFKTTGRFHLQVPQFKTLNVNMQR